MNSKGQLGIGALMIAFIGVIVAVLLYQSIGGFVGESTGSSVHTAYNQSVTFPAAGSSVELYGQEIIGTPIVTNRTDGTTVPASNYTISEGVGTSGVKRVLLTAHAGGYVGKAVNVTYSSYPEGYIDSGGGRSLALLIPILAALAIAVIALAPAIGSGLKDWFN